MTKEERKPHELEVERREDEPIERTMARVTIDPKSRNANLAMVFGSAAFGDTHKPGIMDSAMVVGEEIQRAVNGDLTLASRTLTAQALSLDAIFTEMARRSAMNLGQYPDAVERYMRLALKAQSNCRLTLETLAKLHQPREQTVRHVHVNEGGQAIVADHFHQHAGGPTNAESVKQSHATRTAGQRTALPCPDAGGDGVSIASGEGAATLPDARRD